MSARKQTACIEVGHAIAVTIKGDIAQLACYVGEVQSVDEHGIRVTLMDWLMCAFLGFDLFISWENIEAALVATKQHDIEQFVRRAAEFQNHVNKFKKGDATKPNTQEKVELFRPDRIITIDTIEDTIGKAKEQESKRVKK